MKLDVEHISGIAVLSVTETPTGDESDDLVSTVHQILEKGTCKFVVDLSEMEKIDSVGIESLLKAYTVVAEKNGRLAVVLPSTFLNTHLRAIPELISVFEMHQSREEAIQALLDPATAPHRIEPEARQKLETTESQRPRSSESLIITLGVILLGGLISLAVWLIVAVYHFFT